MDMSYPMIFSSSLLLLGLAHFFLMRPRSRSAIPVQWPVVGMLPALLANMDTYYDYATDVLLRSGHTFMIRGPWFAGEDFLLTCDPANAKHMYSSRFADYPKGDDYREIFQEFGNGITNVDGDVWSKQRKMGVAHTSSREFRSAVADRTRAKLDEAALPLMDEMAHLGRVFDLQDFLKRLTMDVTSVLVIGTDPGCLARDFPAVPFARAIQDLEEVVAYRHVAPKAWCKLLRWLRFGEEKRMAAAVDTIDSFISECIEAARRDKRGRSDLLASYMYRSEEERIDEPYFTSERFLRDTVLTFMGAGADTVAYALAWFFWLVSKSPDAERKIVDEVRGLVVLAEERRGRPVAFGCEETEGLVYVQAALWETLRLYPPIPMNHKVAAKEDVLPSGQRVGPGTRVMFSTYSTGRMEGLWGEDCLEFRPERWIDPATGGLKRPRANAHEFLAFHSGPRTCLGKNVALTQMKAVAAAVVYNFRVEVEEDCKVEPKVAMVMGMKNGLMVKMRKREGSY